MEDHAKQPDPRKRHVFIWKMMRPLARFIAWVKFGFRAVPADVKGPFLLVSNHVTNWDPILVGGSFREQIYYGPGWRESSWPGPRIPSPGRRAAAPPVRCWP